MLVWDIPLLDVRTQLSQFEWDSDEDLIVLTAAHIAKVLGRFVSGNVAADEVETWANMIECREDIGFEAQQEETLKDAIICLANPVSQGPLTLGSAQRLTKQLVTPVKGN